MNPAHYLCELKPGIMFKAVLLLACVALAAAISCEDCVKLKKRIYIVKEDGDPVCLKVGRFGGFFRLLAKTVQDCEMFAASGI